MANARLNGSIATLCIAALTLSACSGNEKDFASVASPDGGHHLVVSVTEPALPHANHIVTVYVAAADGGARQRLIETELANDGVPFTAQNIGIRWTGRTTALVCLRPTDLGDRSIQIDVSGVAHAVIKAGC
jgi:hypothetical protein